jgi:hypothetical protein
MYAPLCFAYILPVGGYSLLGGAIPPEVHTMSKRPFVVMGLLDYSPAHSSRLVFSLPFVPWSTQLKDSDVAGLRIILLGLVT